MAWAKSIEAISNTCGIIAALGVAVAIVQGLEVASPAAPSYTTDGTVIRLENDGVVVSYKDRVGHAAEESFPVEEQSRALQVGDRIQVHDAYAYKNSRRVYLEGQRWQIHQLRFARGLFAVALMALSMRLALQTLFKPEQPSEDSACHSRAGTDDVAELGPQPDQADDASEPAPRPDQEGHTRTDRPSAGAVGRALINLAPCGIVDFDGCCFSARSTTDIAAGSQVVVTGHDPWWVFVKEADANPPGQNSVGAPFGAG